MLDFIYNSLYSLPITITLLSIYNVYIAFNSTSPLQLIIATVFTLFFTGIRSMTFKWRVISVVTTIVGTVLFLSLLASPDNSDIYIKYSYMGIIILLALISFFVTFLIQKVTVPRYLLAVGILVLLGFYMVNQNSVKPIELVFMMVYVLLTVAEIIQKKNHPDDINFKQHTIGISSFIIVGIVLAMWRQIPSEPYGWDFAINLYEKAYIKCIKLMQSLPDSFGVNYDTNIVGYSDFGTIHSALTEADNDKVVLTFKPFSANNTFRYLQGNTFDYFDGQKWNQTFTDNEYDMLTDAAEMTYQLLKSDLNASKCFSMTHADITYHNLKTRHLFVPEKTINILENKTRIDYTTENGASYFNTPKGMDTKYNISYINPYPLSDVLIEKINGEHIQLDELFNYYFSNKVGYGQLGKVSYDDVINRRNMIYEHYADVPEMSEQTKKYLEDITKDATSDFDKLLLIQKALSEYEYTLDINEYPDTIHSSEDFLDYFLFEQKGGYCMYYATAFALLARAEGFPARYVQGYHLQLNGSKAIEVHESDAHAWVQVYVNDFGWIIFDATPGFGNPVVNKTQTVSENTTVSQNGLSTVSANEPEIPDQYKDLMNKPNDNTDEQDLIEYKEKTNQKLLRMIIVISVGSVLVLLLFIILLERIIISRRFSRMDNYNKVLTICNENIRLLKFLNYKLDTGETLEELNIIAGRELLDADLRFIEIYEKCIYSDHIPDNDELEIVIVGNTSLMNSLKTRKHYFKYILARISSFR